MKKLLSLILCFILCLSLFACNTQEFNTTEVTTGTQTTESSVTFENDIDTEEKTVYLADFLKTEGLRSISIKTDNFPKGVRTLEYYVYNDNDISEIGILFDYLDDLVLMPKDDSANGSERPVIAMDILYYSFVYEYGEIFRLMTSGKSIGIFDGDTCVWYYIVYDDADNAKIPIELFEELYKNKVDNTDIDAVNFIKLKVENGRIDIPNKEIAYVEVDIRENGEPRTTVTYRDKDKTNSIRAFFENLDLNNSVSESSLPLTGAGINSVEIRFTDKTYVDFSLLPNEDHKDNSVLGLSRLYYDISDQREALVELLDFNW